MTTPVVHAAYDEMVAVKDLKPNPANPNRHPAEQIELLAAIIAEQGWRAPITVSKRSGLIVKGHGRLEAALLLGLKKAPVDWQDYADEAAELADMIADNRLAELAEMDMVTLKDILEVLDTGAFAMTLTGYDDAALESLMTAAAWDPDDMRLDGPPAQDPEDKGLEPFGLSTSLAFTFEDEDELEDVRRFLGAPEGARAIEGWLLTSKLAELGYERR